MSHRFILLSAPTCCRSCCRDAHEHSPNRTPALASLRFTPHFQPQVPHPRPLGISLQGYACSQSYSSACIPALHLPAGNFPSGYACSQSYSSACIPALHPHTSPTPSLHLPAGDLAPGVSVLPIIQQHVYPCLRAFGGVARVVVYQQLRPYAPVQCHTVWVGSKVRGKRPVGLWSISSCAPMLLCSATTYNQRQQDQRQVARGGYGRSAATTLAFAHNVFVCQR